MIEEGGPYTHGAIMARELGLPTVVGVRGAVAGIPDGADIDVDPVAGVVQLPT